MYRMLLLLFSIILVPSSACAVWEEKYYNPKPMHGDVILPLPCDGAMVFRKVAVPAESVLGDMRLTLGGTGGSGAGYMDGPRTEWLAGGFNDGPAQKYFLIARYETSILQYQAVMEARCPALSQAGRLPQGSVGWFDAVTFTEKLTTWLRRTRPDALPREGDENGFVRLPTETEWEYTARGGSAVSPADFNEPVFPLNGLLSRYVWFSGTQSANGRPQMVGLLEPGPLGMHDMLGNLDEIVLDAFHLIRPGRRHGQPGGFVVRGGNYMTAEPDIRASMRAEVPFFDAKGPRRAATTGFRVVVSVPALTSRATVKAVEEAWNHLGTGGTGDGRLFSGPGQKSGTPIADLVLLADSAVDPELRQSLRNIESALKADLSARDEARDRAARTALRMGAFLGQKLSDDGKWVVQLEAIWKNRYDAEPDEQRTVSYRKQLDESRSVLQDNLRYYADTLIRTAEDYDVKTLSRQKTLLEAEMRNLGLLHLLPYIEKHISHVMVYILDQRVRRRAWLEDFVTL